MGIAYVRWRNPLDNVRIPQGASVANNAARVTTVFLVHLCRNALSGSDYSRSAGRATQNEVAAAILDDGVGGALAVGASRETHRKLCGRSYRPSYMAF